LLVPRMKINSCEVSVESVLSSLAKE
jgi:hypothetical protein